MKKIFIFTSILIVFIANSNIFSETKTDATSIYQQTLKKYGELKSFNAQIECKVYPYDKVTGNIIVEKPNKWKISLNLNVKGKNYNIFNLCTGQYVYDYDPFKNQIIKTVSSSAASGEITQFFPQFSLYDIDTVKLLETLTKNDKIKTFVLQSYFKKNYQNNQFTSVKLWVEEKSWLIKKIEVLNSEYESVMVINFNNIKIDEEIKKEEFEVSIPKGAKLLVER
ncbi:MAG: hypothetical protein PHE88_04445 [Elusimicrobia bacterium]|nr:hypothetical protein [Elusimicrobiota bacterium]